MKLCRWTLNKIHLNEKLIIHTIHTIGRIHHKFRTFSAGISKVESFIKDNTEITSKHLTPEIKLHLITPQCQLWHGRGEECPIADPFWAFYWPGGQALTRLIHSLLISPSYLIQTSD